MIRRMLMMAMVSAGVAALAAFRARRSAARERAAATTA